MLSFVPAERIAPLLYDSPYYVGLGDKAPAKPYVLLRDVMRDSGLVAITKITMRERESLAVLRVASAPRAGCMQSACAGRHEPSRLGFTHERLEHVSEYRASVPSGWPPQVQPPGVRGWEQTATKWLFEQAPGEWRNYHVLRRNPIMLAREVRYLLAGYIEARRAGYARARTDIAAKMTATPGRRDDGGWVHADQIPNIPFTTLDEYLKVHADEAERLKALLAQVQVVEDALTGIRWVPTAPTTWTNVD